MKTSRVIGLLLAIVIVVGVLRFAREQGVAWDFGLLGARHKVTVQWTPSPGAAAYNIYRTTVSGQDYVRVGASSEAKYVDTTVVSKTVYYYAVTAVSGDGKESARSPEIKAAVP